MMTALLLRSSPIMAGRTWSRPTTTSPWPKRITCCARRRRRSAPRPIPDHQDHGRTRGTGRRGVAAVRNIVFHPRGWEDFTYWAAADKKVLRRLLRLIEEAQR